MSGHLSTWQQLTHYLTGYDTWNGSSGLPQETLVQLWVTLRAVALASVLALPIGIGLGHARRGGRLATVLADLTRSVPTYGLLVVLAGFSVIGVGNNAAVLALAVFAIAPILVNAQVGVAGVDADVIDAGRGLGMSGGQILRRVELPLALPLLAAGLRTAGVQTCATATLAAFVGGGGLGTPINLGAALNSNGRGELIAGAAAVIVVTFAVEIAFALVQAGLTPGTRTRALLFRLPLRREHASPAAS